MYSELSTGVTTSGRTFEIGVVLGPDPERRAAVNNLLVHKGGDWQAHIDAAMSGNTDELETRFYVATLDGGLVANVMTTEWHGQGILGHVFTRPEHRRQGICRQVFAAAMRDFAERGGRLLLLGTGFESHPYWIYHSFGFRSLDGGFMRLLDGDAEAYEREWFAPSPVKCVELRWRHGPSLAYMASLPGLSHLRHVGWSVHGLGNLEWQLIWQIRQQLEGGAVRATVLETSDGRAVGAATVLPFSPGAGRAAWPGVSLVDALAYPAFEDGIPELLASLRADDGKQIAFVEVGNVGLRRGLEAVGYACEGTVPGMVASTSGAPDVLVYGRGRV